MASNLVRGVVFVALLSFCSTGATQQRATAVRTLSVDNDSLAQSRLQVSQPERRLSLSGIDALTVRNGDNSTENVRDIVVRSFKEQEDFANRMNKADLVNALAIAARPEIDDEVLVYSDAIVIRRSTTIIVVDPDAVAKESALYRNYLGKQSVRKPTRQRQTSRVIAQPVDLDPEERAGLQDFMRNGVSRLHPNDPLRAAAAQGEDALLQAIADGKGQLTIEDTLIIPRESGVDQGQNIRIPTVRNGVLDLKNPEPVKDMTIVGLGSKPGPMPEKDPVLQVKPVPPPKGPPPRQAPKPKHEATGVKKITAEFLLGKTRSANFQWERTWSYTSGFFRITLGSGYAFGYRVPVRATATVEPEKGYIQDYSDKKVIIGVAASAKPVNGNADFYKRAGLSNEHVKNGRELLLEANVGYGYKFRALWRTIAHRPYTAIGISYSQNFTPPNSAGALQSMSNPQDFGMTLNPSTTKISVDRKFIGGSATIRFDGKVWGALSMDLQTRLDEKTQETYALNTNIATVAGVYKYKIPISPGNQQIEVGSTNTRTFGVRLLNPEYDSRIIVLPKVKFGFRVGYKRLSRNFSTGWIPLNSLKMDTGDMTLKPHSGTRSHYTWDGGKKIYRRIKEPDSGPSRKTG